MDIYADFHNLKKIFLSLLIFCSLIEMWHAGVISAIDVLIASITLSSAIAILYRLVMDDTTYHEVSSVWIFSFIAYTFIRMDFSGSYSNLLKLFGSGPFLLDTLLWVPSGLFIINFLTHINAGNKKYETTPDSDTSFHYLLISGTVVGMGITIDLSGMTHGNIFIFPDSIAIPFYYGLIVLLSQFNFKITNGRSINGIVIVLSFYSGLAIYKNALSGISPPIITIAIELVLLLLFFWSVMKPEQREGIYTGSVIAYPHYRMKFSLVVLWFIILYLTIPKQYQLVESLLIFPLIFFAEFTVDLLKGVIASAHSGRGGIIGGAGPFDSLYSTFSYTIFIYLVFEIFVFSRFFI